MLTSTIETAKPLLFLTPISFFHYIFFLVCATCRGQGTTVGAGFPFSLCGFADGFGFGTFTC